MAELIPDYSWLRHREHEDTPMCHVFHCAWHGVDEWDPAIPNPWAWCLECRHSFFTEDDLVSAHLKVMREMRKALKLPWWRRWLDSRVEKKMRGDKVFSCPMCTHDFF